MWGFYIEILRNIAFLSKHRAIEGIQPKVRDRILWENIHN